MPTKCLSGVCWKDVWMLGIGCRMRSDKAVQQKVNSVCYCLTIGLVIGRQSLLHTQMLKVKDFCSHNWTQHGHLQNKSPWTMSPMLLTMMGLLLLHTFHVCWEIICTPFHYLVSGQTMHFPTTTMILLWFEIFAVLIQTNSRNHQCSAYQLPERDDKTLQQKVLWHLPGKGKCRMKESMSKGGEVGSVVALWTLKRKK